MSLARFVPFVLSAAVCCAVPSSLLAQLPAGATLFASGLQGPRGLAFGPDGDLYVAEAGLGGTATGGGCAQVPAPIGPYTGGLTARISRLDAGGNRTTVTSALPSSKDAQGDVLGVADLAFQNGELYALLAGGGCSHGNPNFPNAVLKVNVANGKWKLVADLSVALIEYPAKYTSPDDYEPDGSWYGMISANDRLYAVEPNHGQVFSVTPEGEVRQVIDLSASQGHIVPTSIVQEKGLLYVGNLNLFPIDPQWAKVMLVAKDVELPEAIAGFTQGEASGKAKVIGSKAGFTTIVSMKVGPDGLLYVLELSAAPGYPSPGKPGRWFASRRTASLRTSSPG